MKKSTTLLGSTLLVCTVAVATVAHAQDGTPQSETGAQISDLLDGFLAEPAELDEEQKGLYTDEAFNYVEDPATTQLVRTEWMKFLVQAYKDESAVKEIEKTLTPGNLQSLVSQWFSDSGFQASNFFDVQAMDVLFNMTMAQSLLRVGTPTEGDLQLRDMFVSIASSAEILERRERTNESKQLSQQMMMLGNILQFQLYSHAVNTGEPLDDFQTRATARLLSTYGIDPRFQTITTEGLRFTPEFTDVISGKKTAEEVYPDLDLVALSESEDSRMTRTAANLLLKLNVKESTDQAVRNEQNAATNPLSAKREEPAVNPLAGGAASATSPFTGRFQGDGLQLATDVENDRATGQLTFNGQQFALTGAITDQTMSGTFRTDAGEFPFDATLDDDAMTFETAGTVYVMKREVD